MKLVSKIEELKDNIETVENYLTEGNDEEKKYIVNLIRLGKCFVAYSVNDDNKKELRFVPSRFIGYIYNSISKHKFNHEKNGGETNRAIRSIIDDEKANIQLDKQYIKFCKSLGIEPSKRSSKNPRRFWLKNLGDDFEINKQLEGDFPEGVLVERTHKKYERIRNNKVVDIAKKNFKSNHDKLYCQICGFDFEKNYGAVGKNFIEAHHTIPVSEMKEGHITKPEDIAMLCSNCHKMVHRKRPWLTMQKLNTIIMR